MKVNRRCWAVAAGIGMLVGLPASAEPAAEPWETGQGGRIVTDAEGRVEYVWPPVSDVYVMNATLAEVARWVQRQWSVKAGALHSDRNRRQGAVSDVVHVIPERGPLSLAQWEALATRAATAWRTEEPKDEQDAMAVIGLIDMLEPQHFGDGSPGCRAIADEALRRLLLPDASNPRGLAHLAAGFSSRSGDTGLLRRLASELRGAATSAQGPRLAQVIAVGSWSEHDLNAAEMVALAVSLLEQSNVPGLSPLERITISEAALRMGALISPQLLDDALASEHAQVRGVALRWATGQTRTARAEGDAKALGALTARTDRFVAAFDDPDERVAGSAMGTVMVILEDQPAAWAGILLRGLGTRPPGVDAMACMYLMEVPEHAASAKETIRTLAASPDPDLRQAAGELLALIVAKEKE